MQAAVSDKSSKEYQRMSWEALRKSINGLINKVNTGNMANILPELFHENLVRGRGLFCRAVMKAQMASPGFTHVYAALVAVVNTKLPEAGELLLKRVIIQFRRAYRRNNKVVAVALAKFMAHLVNQQVAHELLALQMVTLLLENPTDDSVEVAIGFVKECGAMLADLTPAGMHAIFERFRGILHEGDIDKRVQYMIEALFAVRKAKFADFPSVLPELDLVERDDQITHEIGLDDDTLAAEEALDVFRFDSDYEANEALWAQVRTEILGEDVEEGAGGGEGGGVGSGEEMGGEEAEAAGYGSDSGGAPAPPPPSAAAGVAMTIADMSETDLINLRRTIYLTIMNSLDFEECAHKLMKLNMPRGTEMELANMLIECCSQEKTFIRMYGLLAQRFCLISRWYQEAFETAFGEQYSTIHRLEINKLRNVAKFFAHLLHTDALPWTVFEYIRLNEDETTSSSRIFIKILMQELSEYMGLLKLRERCTDPVMAGVMSGVFPKDTPRNTRFSINFFTSIGLGALTDDLRAHLKALPKIQAAQQQSQAAAEAAAAAAAAAAAPPAAAVEKKAKRRGRSASTGSSDSYSTGSYSYSSGSYSYSYGSGSYSYDSRSYSSYDSRSRSPSRSESRGRSKGGKGKAASRGRSPSPRDSGKKAPPAAAAAAGKSSSAAAPSRDDVRRRGRSPSYSASRSRSPPRRRDGSAAPAPVAAANGRRGRSPSRSASPPQQRRQEGGGGNRRDERPASSSGPANGGRGRSPPRQAAAASSGRAQADQSAAAGTAGRKRPRSDDEDGGGDRRGGDRKRGRSASRSRSRSRSEARDARRRRSPSRSRSRSSKSSRSSRSSSSRSSSKSSRSEDDDLMAEERGAKEGAKGPTSAPAQAPPAAAPPPAPAPAVAAERRRSPSRSRSGGRGVRSGGAEVRDGRDGTTGRGRPRSPPPPPPRRDDRDNRGYGGRDGDRRSRSCSFDRQRRSPPRPYGGYGGGGDRGRPYGGPGGDRRNDGPPPQRNDRDRSGYRGGPPPPPPSQRRFDNYDRDRGRADDRDRGRDGGYRRGDDRRPERRSPSGSRERR